MKKRILSIALSSAIALGTVGGAFAEVELPAETDQVVETPGEVVGAIPPLEVKTSKAYINGYGGGTFSPGSVVKRAEVAKMIAVIRDLSEKPENFDDVPNDHWAAGFIGAVKESGIMEGDPAGKFNPLAGLTRGELAAIVSRMIPDAAGAEKNFSDIESHWAKADIQKAVRAGIVSGYPDGTFKPHQEVTRAEAVKLLNGAIGILKVDEKISDKVANPFSDISGNWAKDHILAASTEYKYTADKGTISVIENTNPVISSAKIISSDENATKIEVKFSKIMNSLTIDEANDVSDFKIYVDGVDTTVVYESPKGFVTDPADPSTFDTQTDTFTFTIRALTETELAESDLTIMAVEGNDVADIIGKTLNMDKPVVIEKK